MTGSVEQLQALLKAELQQRGVDYRQLVKGLAHMGVEETEAGLVEKLDRGGADKEFLLQC